MGSAKPQAADVDCSCQEDADDEQQRKAVYPSSGKERDEHGDCCNEQEGENVFQGRMEGIANLLIEEAVPDAGPQDDDANVGDDHVGDVAAESMDDENEAEDGAALGDDVPHVNVGFAT